ncbi:filamin-binding LIM protein 1 [Brachionichthys hirsutus]|uniref:filamin-binding LIM protein 1 n=1 Tax=Brachionichthys hirsutus TaxID=412623 RepID=UPI0036049288
MATAAPPKRVVSSFFITLASPQRGTVTQQQQPALQTHSRDKQHASVRVSPTDSIPSIRHKKEGHLQAEPYGGLNRNGKTQTGAATRGSDPQNPRATRPGLSGGKLQEDDTIPPENRTEVLSLPPPPPPPPSAVLPSSLGLSFSEEPALPPPPSAQTAHYHPPTPAQQPVYNTEEETSTPSSGLKQDESSEMHQNGQDTSRENKDVCGFCRKPVALSQPAIEALNRIYHDGCFQCRSCHIPLAGKEYYNKAGIPLCTDCYQASLELCWACGEAITDHVIRALERAYHLSCFTCATCQQQIGEQRFAQGEVGEVYCLQDYYRKYAPKCNACKQLIIPKEDGTDSYNVECLGHSYHENCYRCEVCLIQLSPEPNEKGCYPLDGKMLCKPCHMSHVSGQH